MSPILFLVPGSCAFGSIVALEKTGQPYRLTRLEASAHSAESDFRQINPNGQVPAMLDGDRLLVESVAILHHIGAGSEGSRVVPKPGTKAFDDFNIALGFLATTFHTGFHPIYHPEAYGPDAVVHRAIRQAYIESMPSRYERLDDVLAQRPWLAGGEATAVDYYFYGMARWGDEFIDTDQFSRVAAFRARLAEDPAVQFALAIEEGRDASSTGNFEGLLSLDDVVKSVSSSGAPVD